MNGFKKCYQRHGSLVAMAAAGEGDRGFLKGCPLPIRIVFGSTLTVLTCGKDETASICGS